MLTRSANPQKQSISTILAREYYVSEHIFAEEVEKVLSRQWTYAGHMSQISNTGDYFVVDLLGESLVFVRGDGGEIRGFYNVCRHRGHILCTGRSGRKKRAIVCPYHQWSYQFDGTLRSVPGIKNGEQFDFKDWSLIPVQVEVWHGLIFTCLSRQPIEPLAPVIANMGRNIPEDMLYCEPDRLKLIYEEVIDVAANWKTLVENYLECYHCRASHPELCIAFDVDARSDNTEAYKSPISGSRDALRPAVKTLSIDGEYISKPLGKFAKDEERPLGFDAGFAILPTLTRVIFRIDHCVVHTLRPIGVAHSQWVTRWLVNEDAVEGADYTVEGVIKLWRIVNRQDIGLSENAYKGVRSRSFMPGPLHDTQEAAVTGALQIYLDMMSDGPAGRRA
jgi:Rieske 2Fe-2S family protein